jgi:hypothetical protein
MRKLSFTLVPLLLLVSNPNIVHATNVNGTVQGWTPQPDGRGTLDIIWSCSFTIFLCSWSVLCMNVPAQGEKLHRIIWLKLELAWLGIVGPEFTMTLALGQYASARRSVRQFHASGYKQWSMTHAFFADMGGFLLKTPNWPVFPVDAKQIHYLLSKGYITLPWEHLKASIDDKNKADGLVRLITIIQTVWFSISSLARVAQQLVLTTLELTTLGFIFCTLPTSFCWFYKPCDVGDAIVLDCDTPIAEILIRAGEDARNPYFKTPLDFVSREEWSWSLYWSCWTNTLKRMGIRFSTQGRPMNRIPNDFWPICSQWTLFTFFIFSMIYGAVFLGGWNFHFATTTELYLWRIAVVTNMSVITLTWVIDTMAFTILPALNVKFSMHRGIGSNTEARRQRRWFGAIARSAVLSSVTRMRNNSLERDPALNVPLRAILPITVCGALYCVARGFVLIEDFVGLRELPSSAYQTVKWSAFLPHL